MQKSQKRSATIAAVRFPSQYVSHGGNRSHGGSPPRRGWGGFTYVLRVDVGITALRDPEEDRESIPALRRCQTLRKFSLAVIPIPFVAFGSTHPNLRGGEPPCDLFPPCGPFPPSDPFPLARRRLYLTALFALCLFFALRSNVLRPPGAPFVPASLFHSVTNLYGAGPKSPTRAFCRLLLFGFWEIIFGQTPIFNPALPASRWERPTIRQPA
jgi:hypothetical protein